MSSNYEQIVRLVAEREHNLRQLEAFRTEHEAVLAQHDELLLAIDAAEAEIRRLAASEPAGEIVIDHTSVLVKRTAAPKHYDSSILLANCPELKQQHPEMFSLRVDSRAVQRLVRSGVIPDKVARAALRLGPEPAPKVIIGSVAEEVA